MDGRGLGEDVASRNTLRCFPRVIPDTSGMVIRVKTENITDTHNTTQHSPGPLQSNYCILSCQARCFGDQSICHWWQRLPSQPPPQKKGVLKLIRAPSKAAGKVLTCRETRVTWWQLHWTLGLIYIFVMASAVSESLIEAIARVCWVKVASFALGKCRVAAILTLLWCYFEEGLRRIARAFSGQSSY